MKKVYITRGPGVKMKDLAICAFYLQVFVQAIDTVTAEMSHDFITTATGSNKPYHIFVQLGNAEIVQGKYFIGACA